MFIPLSPPDWSGLTPLSGSFSLKKEVQDKTFLSVAVLDGLFPA